MNLLLALCARDGDYTIEVLDIVGRDVHVRLSKPGEPDEYVGFDAQSVADVSSRYTK